MAGDYHRIPDEESEGVVCWCIGSSSGGIDGRAIAIAPGWAEAGLEQAGLRNWRVQDFLR